MLEKDSGPRPEGRKEEKGKRKVAQVTAEFAGVTGKLDTSRQIASRGWYKSLNAVEEDKGDISEEVRDDEDELHAWCLLEVSESEQWQEVTSKKSKLKTKKFAHELLLSVQAIPARVQGKPLK